MLKYITENKQLILVILVVLLTIITLSYMYRSSTEPSSVESKSEVCSETFKTSYDELILQDSPVLYLVSSKSGNVCDYSSNKFETTLSGPLSNTSLPNGDFAIEFNGVDSYIAVADVDALSPLTTGMLTIEAWMRPDTLEFENDEGSGYVHWLGKGEKDNQEFVARMYSYTNTENRPNRISGYAFSAEGGLGVGSYFEDLVQTGEWIHYVLVINIIDTNESYPLGYTKIYKNGILRDQDSLAELNIVLSKGSAPFRVGTRDFNSFFKGAIGKIALYDFELNPHKVLEHYEYMARASD